MSFLARVKMAYQSKAARMLSTLVLLALLAPLVVLTTPKLVVEHLAATRSLLLAEQNRLQDALNHVVPGQHRLPESLLTPNLIGLILQDQGGAEVLSKGDLPVLDRSSVELDSMQSHRSGTVDVSWFLQSSQGDLTATARIDKRHLNWETATDAVFLLCLALVAGLAASLVLLYGIARCYINPVEELVLALQESRIKSGGNVPEDVDLSHTEDLNPLAEEFNSLIDAQRKAARQVKVKQQYLEFAAHHDPLTHLPNRLMFEDTLRKTVANAGSKNERFAVFLVDLDNFKFFNDQYGHLVGDKMVAEVGNRLRTMMRDIDLVARLDGDEFVVIQKDVCDRQSAEEVAKRVMSVATAPYEYRGFTLKASVSVGISCFPCDVHDGQDDEMMGEEIVNNAAVALQDAKSKGKNQYQLFNEQMRSSLTARIRLEQDLKIALQEEQFEVFYQPKINIHTRQITGAEALVRWRHPANSYISPEVFVPVAEEAGMIIELGEWILRTACRQTHQLQEQGYKGLNVAVNISAVQFTDGNLLPMITRALSDTMLKPELLELEITESAVMHDPEEVILSLHELSRCGMRLAIDDFGTGYSSLAYLKRFPVDTLKIDRAFITDVSSDNDDVAIVEAVLGLGKHFNMKVVAEGVEDEEQLQFLRKQGCDLAQGFWISKPMSYSKYTEFLKTWPHGLQGDDSLQGDDIQSDAQSNVVPIATGSDRRRH